MNLASVTEALARHHRALSFAGVATLVVAAWLASTAYSAPVEERALERQTSWTESSAFTYRVPVTRNSTHWPIGTELPMGEPAYFRTVSDSIYVDYAWSPETGDPHARGVAGGRLYVRVVATSYDGRPYWSLDRTLDETTVADATEGLRLSGRVDLDELVNDLAVLQKELPVTEGTVNWSVRANVVYALDVAGAREQGESERLLPIDAGDPRFTLPTADKLRWNEVHAQDRVHSRVHPAGVPGVLASTPALGLAALAATFLVAGVALSRPREGEPFDQEYRRFKDWVSAAGRIPDHSAHPSSTIDVRTLEDLVHVAADARTRVVLDERSRVFYAFLPGATYRYARHAY